MAVRAGRWRFVSDPGSGARPRPAVVLFGATGAIAWLVRWLTATSHVAGDSFWYAKQALELAGVPSADAAREAGAMMVRAGHGVSVEGWVQAVGAVDPRYQAIFATRPLFPLLAAPFTPFLGADALIPAAWIAGVLFAVALGIVAERLTGSAILGVAAIALAYALPGGGWIAFLYADGLMLALWVAGLGLLSWFLLSGDRRSLAWLGAAFVLLLVTKSANATALAAAAVAAGAISAVRPGAGRARGRDLALAGLALLAGQIVVSAVLGLPDARASAEDLLTAHFTRAEVPDPWLQLLRLDVHAWRDLLAAAVPTPVAGAVLGAGLLGLARPSWAVPWLVGAAVSAGLLLLHPVVSEVPRLIAPAWVAAALGIACWARVALRRGGGFLARPGAPAEV